MITTGGTIACIKTNAGLSPKITGDMFLPDRIKNICDIDVIDLLNIDSTDMDYENIDEIAKTIWENRKKYDGFVVLHGTDTMAYSAAFSATVLKNFNKPVIFTGSMIPMGQENSDAEDNLFGAFSFVLSKYKSVGVFIGGVLINAHNASKTNSQSNKAFSSINAPIDGEINDKDEIVIYNCDEKRGQEEFVKKRDWNVAVIKLSPIINEENIDNFKKYSKVIIEGFGEGGIPKKIERQISAMIKNGIKVYIKTQCAFGGVNLRKYSVGQRAEKLGVISLTIKTTEDALAAAICDCI